MIEYVLGFMFNLRKTRVALIKKQKPEWQKDKWNGIGGKVEYDEPLRAAMAREFFEETGLHTSSHDWDRFALIEGNGYVVHCYRAFDDAVEGVRSIQQPDGITEEVEVHDVFWPPVKGSLPNIPWLIRLALDPEPSLTTSVYL